MSGLPLAVEAFVRRELREGQDSAWAVVHALREPDPLLAGVTFTDGPVERTVWDEGIDTYARVRACWFSRERPVRDSGVVWVDDRGAVLWETA